MLCPYVSQESARSQRHGEHGARRPVQQPWRGASGLAAAGWAPAMMSDHKQIDAFLANRAENLRHGLALPHDNVTSRPTLI